eukprot:152836-Chlamydomonas_euryale.AAC.1
MPTDLPFLPPLPNTNILDTPSCADLYAEPSMSTDYINDEFQPTWQKHLKGEATLFRKEGKKPDLRVAVVQ